MCMKFGRIKKKFHRNLAYVNLLKISYRVSPHADQHFNPIKANMVPSISHQPM